MTLAGLVAVWVGVAAVTMDISLTSTAVPSIAQGIGASPASTIWIVNVYYLTVIAALLPLAALGEIFGHRRIFAAGLATFALGALLSGLATSLPTLAAARGLLGIGSAAVSATTPALIRSLYPPARLAQGLGLYAMVVGVSYTVGPMLASAVLAVMSWPWLFLLNVPIAVVAMAMAARGLPETERNVRPFEPGPALLCAGLFGSLLFAIAGLAHLDASSVIIAFAASLACGGWLRRLEAGKAAPIFAVDLFRSPLFSLSAATSVCAFVIQGLVFVVLPFLFQFRLGHDAVAAGFLIMPWPATLALMTVIAAPLSNRVAPGLLGGLGLMIVAIGLLLLTWLESGASAIDIGWRLVLCGIGFGLFQSPNMVAMMTSAPPRRSGGAGGILAASRLLGQSIGAAVVGYCVSTWPDDGSEIALRLGAAFAVVGTIVSLSRLLPSIRVRRPGGGD